MRRNWGSEMHTVADTAANETGNRKEAIKDAVRSVGEDDVLSASGAQIGDGTEHAYGGKAGEHE